MATQGSCSALEMPSMRLYAHMAQWAPPLHAHCLGNSRTLSLNWSVFYWLLKPSVRITLNVLVH